MFLKYQMKEGLAYFIDKVDKPLVKAIVFLAGRYPDPTHETVLHPNSHRLLDIRDKFLRCWDFGDRNPLFLALFKLLVVKYEQSPQYRNVLDWFIGEIPPDWKPFNVNRQMRCWKGR